MTADTVQASSPGQREKKSVETTEFDAFARRILRAYGRRVAAGDIEALRSLATFAGELDAVTRHAVSGLRQEPYAYSWAEIGSRLGVTRQAAQMRFAELAAGDRLDQRLIAAGQTVPVAVLVAVFADHHPGTPPAVACPGCGFRYPDGVTDCPTNATVRPLLYQRRAEDTTAVDLLTSTQFTDLHSPKTARTHRVAARRSAHPTPSPDRAETLLDLIDNTNREDSTS